MSWSVLTGKSMHAPCRLSGRCHSEWECQSWCSGYPLLQREKWWPQVHTVILSSGTSMCPHTKSTRVHFILKHVKSIFTGMYKPGYIQKQKHQVFMYMASLGSRAEFMLVSQWCEWHFQEISLKLVNDMNWWFSIIGQNFKLLVCSGSFFKVLLCLKFYSIPRSEYSFN